MTTDTDALVEAVAKALFDAECAGSMTGKTMLRRAIFGDAEITFEQVLAGVRAGRYAEATVEPYLFSARAAILETLRGIMEPSDDQKRAFENIKRDLFSADYVEGEGVYCDWEDKAASTAWRAMVAAKIREVEGG